MCATCGKVISSGCAMSVKGKGSEGETHDRRAPRSVGDQDDLRSAREAERERFKQVQSSPKFVTIHEMTQRFVTYFKTLHTERECVAGVYMCVICRSALTTLGDIRTAITKDPQGRRAILSSGTFMTLLVKLCNLNSRGGPNICAVSGQETKQFYEGRVYRNLKGAVRVLEDPHSELCWERFLGAAAKKIRTLAYAVSFGSARIPGGSSCVWPARDAKQSSKDELLPSTPTTAPQKATQFPVSDVRSLDVSGAMDAQHLWVYSSSEAREDAAHLSSLLLESHRALLKCPSQESPPSVGDIAGLLVSSECLLRVLVLQVTANMAVVWSMDRGNFYSVDWHSLIGLLPSFKQLPPAVSLGMVQGVSAVPFLKLLRDCVRVFQMVTKHNDQEGSFHAFMVTKLTQVGAVEVLTDLLHCPDYDTRMDTIRCLVQLCSRQKGRQAVTDSGCVSKALDRLKKLLDQHRKNSVAMVTDEKLHLVDLVQALFFRNEELMLEYADSDILQVLLRVQKSSSPGCSLYDATEYCLHTILGPAFEKCRPAAQIKLAAMTPEHLEQMKHLGSTSNMAPSSSGAGGRFYLHATGVPVAQDNRHELRPLSSMRLASSRTLAKLACSFLNTWRPCTIFYGISREGHVHGVPLTLRERDTLRQSVDLTMSSLGPRLPPTLFSVEFVPVLRSGAEAREGASRFVVEVHMCGAPHTLYTTREGDCYLRSGGQSYMATTMDVRAWVAQQEEARFLRAVADDASRPLPTNVHLPTSRSWDMVVY